MAGNEVSYTIRLRDQMSAALKRMGLSVDGLRSRLSKGLAGGLAVASKAMKGMTIAAGSVITAATGVGYAAVRMGQSFLDAASQLEDTQAKFGVVFQGIEDEATEMAATMAEQLGYGEGSIMGMMATLQDTLVPMGFARDEAAEFSGALTSLAADLASFNPGIRDAEQAVGMLQSVLVGMNRSALNFGVVINEDKIAAEALALGLGDVNGELTDQEKVMARVSLLMKGTADAQGDAIRTADSYKNSTRALNEAITDLREEIGARLKTELEGAVRSIGGVDVIINATRVSFEFFAAVLTDLIIPTAANLLTNFAKFVESMGGVDAAVVGVSEVVALMGKTFKVMWDTVKVVLYLFQQGLDVVVFAVKSAWEVIKLLTGLIGLGLVGALQLAFEAAALFVKGLNIASTFVKDTVITVFQGLINTIADVVGGIGDAMVSLGEFDVVPDFIRDAGQAAKDAAAGMREFSTSADDLRGPSGILEGMEWALEQFGAKLEPTQEMLRGFISETYDNLQQVGTEFVDAIVEDVPAIQSLFQEIQQGAAGIGTDYDALAEKVGAALQGLQDIQITTPEQADQVAALADHLERMNVQLEKTATLQPEVTQTSFGVSEAFSTVGEAAYDFAENQLPSMQESLVNITQGAIANFSTGLTNAFMSVIDGSASAGEAFTRFAAQFLLQITSMIIQALIFRAIRGAMGIPFADGGVIGGGTGDLVALANGGTLDGGLGRLMPVKGYATGGPIVDKPHVALIGEGKHNEAVVPLPDGRSIPVDLQGAPETQVNISIDAVDGQSVDRLLYDRSSTLRSIITQALQESRTFRGAVARA